VSRCIICNLASVEGKPSAGYIVAGLVVGLTVQDPLVGICYTHNVMVHSAVAAVTVPAPASESDANEL
jgi:hypothetical protein